MNRNSIVLILSVLAVVVAATAGGYASGKRVAERAQLNGQSQVASMRADRQTTGDRAPQRTMTVTYNAYGFMPNILTVKAGTVVRVINASSKPVLFRSTPCGPTTPELNVGVLADSSSPKTFVAVHKGTWQFENAYAPGYQGRLTVR